MKMISVFAIETFLVRQSRTEVLDNLQEIIGRLGGFNRLKEQREDRVVAQKLFDWNIDTIVPDDLCDSFLRLVFGQRQEIGMTEDRADLPMTERGRSFLYLHLDNLVQ